MIKLGNLLVDHSISVFRISNVSYVHSIKSKASDHTIILQQRCIFNMRQLFVTNNFLTDRREEKT